MPKHLAGSKTISSNDGKTNFDIGKSKLQSTDPVSGIMSTFYIGEVAASLVGGSLNGVAYTYYWLTINIHHTFSEEYPDLTPLYEFWRDYQTAYDQQIIANDMGTVVNPASAGTWTETKQHKMVRSKYAPTVGEYLQFSWNVTRLTGTITIPAVVLRLIPHIKFFSTPLPIAVQGGQGGGGGILAETFDFYV